MAIVRFYGNASCGLRRLTELGVLARLGPLTAELTWAAWYPTPLRSETRLLAQEEPNLSAVLCEELSGRRGGSGTFLSLQLFRACIALGLGNTPRGTLLQASLHKARAVTGRKERRFTRVPAFKHDLRVQQLQRRHHQLISQCI